MKVRDILNMEVGTGEIIEELLLYWLEENNKHKNVWNPEEDLKSIAKVLLNIEKEREVVVEEVVVEESEAEIIFTETTLITCCKEMMDHILYENLEIDKPNNNITIGFEKESYIQLRYCPWCGTKINKD